MSEWSRQVLRSIVEDQDLVTLRASEFITHFRSHRVPPDWLSAVEQVLHVRQVGQATELREPSVIVSLRDGRGAFPPITASMQYRVVFDVAKRGLQLLVVSGRRLGLRRERRRDGSIPTPWPGG
jgi:hypothetical protein